jgi:hypothetical protein
MAAEISVSIVDDELTHVLARNLESRQLTYPSEEAP